MMDYDDHLGFVLEYFTQNISTFPEILGFGNTLVYNNKHKFVLRLCAVSFIFISRALFIPFIWFQYGQEKVEHIEHKREEVEARRKALEKREREIQKHIQERKQPVPLKEEEAEINAINETRKFLDGLPVYLYLFWINCAFFFYTICLVIYVSLERKFEDLMWILLSLWWALLSR